jgi:hypothetical protein
MAYSAGSALGTVERNWATFISGPLRPPRRSLRSSAWSALLVLRPKALAPTTRAAMPPTAPDVRAMRSHFAEQAGLVVVHAEGAVAVMR